MVGRRGIEPRGLAVKGMRWKENVFSLIRRLLCRKLAILTKGQINSCLKIFHLVSLNKDLKNDKYQLLNFQKTTT